MERRVLLLPESALQSPLMHVVCVPCPRNGTRQVLLADVGRVAELTRVQRPLGSWFLDDSLEGRGGVMHIASNMDPLFIVLPLLEQNVERFRPWTDIVGESDAAYGKLVTHLPQLSQALSSICDAKEIPGLDTIVIRLNEERAFRWLLCKVDSVLNAIKAGAAGRSSNSATAVARTLAVDNSASQAVNAAEESKMAQQQLQTAVDVVCEYVSSQWQKRLYQHYGLQESKRDVKLMSLFAEQNRVASNGARFVEPPTNDVPSGAAVPPAATGSKKEAPVLSSAQKRLRKVDTKGMTSLSSFFPKKQKPAPEELE